MPIRITLAHGVRGGMEHQADSLARGLAAAGHEVTVVTTAHPHGRVEETMGDVETLYIPATTWRRYEARWWAESYRLLAQRHIYTPYDVILSQSAGALGYIARAREELGLATVVVFHGSARGELITAWRGARSARGVYRLGRLVWRLPRLLALWRRVAASVAWWTAPNATMANENRREIGFPADRLSIIPNAVDTNLFRPDLARRAATRMRLGLPADAPVLVVASRLEVEKGVQVALDALARLSARWPEARLIVAGEGAHAMALQARADALGVGHATLFLGFVAHERLTDILNAGDVFVMPSLCHEAFPVSIIEALAAGLPVVASHVGGVPAAIAVGASGYLVPPGDADGLAAAVARLLADPTRRRTMGALTRQVAEARYTEAAMTRAVESVLQAVVAPVETPPVASRPSDARMVAW